MILNVTLIRGFFCKVALYLKHSKTHRGRRLIMDPIAHVVTDADDADGQNQPFDAKIIEIRVDLRVTLGSRSRVDLAPKRLESRQSPPHDST